MLHLEPARKATALDLARLVTRVNEGNPLEVRADAAEIDAFVREQDVDLDRSVVAFDAGRPVGLALVARRGRDGHLAEIGLAPEARGLGHAGPLLEMALVNLAEAGAARCTLEVLDANARARELYARHAFRATRELPCYRTRELVGRNLDVSEVPPASVRRLHRADAAWGNAAATAAHAHARAFASPAGYAVAKPTPRGVVLYDVGGADPGAVVDGLGALCHGLPASHVNVTDSATAAALGRRGWERHALQIEMVRELTP